MKRSNNRRANHDGILFLSCVSCAQLATMQRALDQAHTDLQQARSDVESQKTQFQVQLELADEMLRAKVRTQRIELHSKQQQFKFLCIWPCSHPHVVFQHDLN
jgi:hypothetical protein